MSAELSSNGSTAFRKRTRLNFEEKMQIFSKYHSEKVSLASLCREWDVSMPTIKRIVHPAAHSGTIVAPCTKQGAVVYQMEKLLTIWIDDQIQRNVPITREHMKTKAVDLYIKTRLLFPLVTLPFVANDGWLARYRQRVGLCDFTLADEPDVDLMEKVKSIPNDLKAVIEVGGYYPQQVFNVESVLLFWKGMPDGTYISKQDEQRASDRITVLLGCNASGDCKLNPLVVHNPDKSTSIKDLHKAPLHFQSNDKSWLTAQNFEEWFLKHFVSETEEFCRHIGIPFKILLILDTALRYRKKLCDLHPSVKVVFLPKGTSRLLEPIVQGIASVFKANYLANTLKMVSKVTRGDSDIMVQDFCDAYNLQKGAWNIKHAWDAIPSKCLIVAWTNLCTNFTERYQLPKDKLYQEIKGQIIMTAAKLGFEMNMQDVENLIQSKGSELPYGDLAMVEKKIKAEEQNDEMKNKYSTKKDVAEDCKEPTVKEPIKAANDNHQPLSDKARKQSTSNDEVDDEVSNNSRQFNVDPIRVEQCEINKPKPLNTSVSVKVSYNSKEFNVEPLKVQQCEVKKLKPLNASLNENVSYNCKEFNSDPLRVAQCEVDKSKPLNTSVSENVSYNYKEFNVDPVRFEQCEVDNPKPLNAALSENVFYNSKEFNVDPIRVEQCEIDKLKPLNAGFSGKVSYNFKQFEDNRIRVEQYEVDEAKPLNASLSENVSYVDRIRVEQYEVDKPEALNASFSENVSYNFKEFNGDRIRIEHYEVDKALPLNENFSENVSYNSEEFNGDLIRVEQHEVDKPKPLNASFSENVSYNSKEFNGDRIRVEQHEVNKPKPLNASFSENVSYNCKKFNVDPIRVEQCEGDKPNPLNASISENVSYNSKEFNVDPIRVEQCKVDKANPLNASLSENVVDDLVMELPSKEFPYDSLYISDGNTLKRKLHGNYDILSPDSFYEPIKAANEYQPLSEKARKHCTSNDEDDDEVSNNSKQFNVHRIRPLNASFSENVSNNCNEFNVDGIRPLNVSFNENVSNNCNEFNVDRIKPFNTSFTENVSYNSKEFNVDHIRPEQYKVYKPTALKAGLNENAADDLIMELPNKEYPYDSLYINDGNTLKRKPFGNYVTFNLDPFYELNGTSSKISKDVEMGRKMHNPYKLSPFLITEEIEFAFDHISCAMERFEFVDPNTVRFQAIRNAISDILMCYRQMLDNIKHGQRIGRVGGLIRHESSAFDASNTYKY